MANKNFIVKNNIDILGTSVSTVAGTLSFGTAQFKQFLNFWDSNWGLGMQNNTAYLRTSGRFSIHLSGTHSNTENDPGAGGTNLFTITNSEIKYKTNDILHTGNYGNAITKNASIGDNYIDFGPNTTWGATLRVGGNGYTGNTRASIMTTDGNLHLDAADGHYIYLNHIAGDAVYFGNGTGNTIVASVSNTGVFTGNGSGLSDIPWSNIVSKPTRANWASLNSQDIVVGQLAWRNSSNYHTIFDASAGLSPDGGVVNKSNSDASWVPTHPTLMGWNGVNTYGVRVDSARNADYVRDYIPVQMGTGIGQSMNTVKIGWDNDSKLRLTVDSTDLGYFALVDYSTNVLSSYVKVDWANILNAPSSSITLTDDTATNATRYINFSSATSGTVSTLNTSSSKLTFNPSTGTLFATEFNSSSDVTLKTNIQPIIDPLNIINRINPVKFDWIETNKTSYGVIAQELESILPELVTVGAMDIKSVNYNALTGIIIAAIKELANKIGA